MTMADIASAIVEKSRILSRAAAVNDTELMVAAATDIGILARRVLQEGPNPAQLTGDFFDPERMA